MHSQPPKSPLSGGLDMKDLNPAPDFIPDKSSDKSRSGGQAGFKTTGTWGWYYDACAIHISPLWGFEVCRYPVFL